MTFILQLIFSGAITGIMIGFLMSLSIIIPDEIQNAIIYVIGHLNYLSGLLPISNLMSMLGFYLLALTAFYVLKIALWLFGMLPGIGKFIGIPTIRNTETTIHDDTFGSRKIISRSKSVQKLGNK